MVVKLDDVLVDRSQWQPTRCSIAKAIDVVGTRSAILILREAYYGTTRFDDFADRVGITPAVAATRLKELVAHGLLSKVPYREPGQRTRYEYRLTEAGEDLLPAVLALMLWGDRHQQDDGGPLEIVDSRTGDGIRVAIVGGSGEVVPPSAVLVRPRRSRERSPGARP